MAQYMTQTSESYQPDNLVAGETQLVSRTYTLATGQGLLKRGTMMGQVTVGGKLLVSTTAATDGSQNPVGVLYDDYDTTAGDTFGGCYVKAELNGNAMTFGAGWTAATAFPVLRDLGIYLKPVLAQSGQNIP